jgi:tetratricopeptide (TPR) repeat protein
VIASPPTDRKTIPRWRSFAATLARGELNPLYSPAPHLEPAAIDSVTRQATDFERFRGRVFAADLVASALVAGPSDRAREIAAAIVSGTIDSTGMVRRIAGLVAAPPREHDPANATPPDAEPGPQMHDLRRGLRESPRNALRWADIARLQTIAGNSKAASRSMSVALALAPENRYVLRGAVRLKLHMREHDAAAAILERAHRTIHDPWLLAAEIAVADISQRRSRNLRRAKQMLDDERFSDFDTSELASSLATVELAAGDQRAARRLFRRALLAPNDNSIAQAEWAAPQVGLEVDPARLATPTAWEARALAAHREGDPARASAEAWRWLDDQPFAGRPAEFGSYEASSDGQFRRGFEFAQRGLQANPKSFLLRNNAAFCLLSLGQVPHAERHMRAIRREQLSRDDRDVFDATVGLYHYRTGDPVTGRAMYESVINGGKEARARTLATIMFAREELRAGAPGARELIARAKGLAERPDAAGLRVWLAQLAPRDIA